MKVIAFLAGFAGGMVVQIALLTAADYLIAQIIPPVVPEVFEEETPKDAEPEIYLPEQSLEWEYFGPRPWWVDQWNSGCGCGCTKGA